MSGSSTTDIPPTRPRGLLAGALLVVALFLFTSPAQADSGLKPHLETVVIKRNITRENASAAQTIAVFYVEKAANPVNREKGLAGRNGMPEDRGMLFVLEEGEQNFFWMKGMKFRIDILFFSRDGKLLKVLYDLDVCHECPLFSSPENTAYALEINAGLAKKFGIRPGDSLVLGGGR